MLQPSQKATREAYQEDLKAGIDNFEQQTRKLQSVKITSASSSDKW
jgi:hypothetical protein